MNQHRAILRVLGMILCPGGLYDLAQDFKANNFNP
jgi:hypothetical protein